VPKKQVITDSSDNIIECFTIGKAAKYLGIPIEHLKIQLYQEHMIPYYKLIGVSGKRIIRITKTDLDRFKVDRAVYDRIADKIKQARTSMTVVKKGISQVDLAKELKCSTGHINYVERKRVRISIKMLKKIGDITGRDLEWFLGD
jgi:hypothetical protein